MPIYPKRKEREWILMVHKDLMDIDNRDPQALNGRQDLITLAETIGSGATGTGFADLGVPGVGLQCAGV